MFIIGRSLEPRVPILEPIALYVSTFRLSLHGVGGFRGPQEGTVEENLR